MRMKMDVVLGEMRQADDATPMTSAQRENFVIPAGMFVFDTDTGVTYVGDGETVGGKPLAMQTSATAYVYGVDVDKSTTYNGTTTPVSSTTRTKVVLNHAYDYAGAATSMRYHAVESFVQTPAHAFHAVLRDLKRGRDVVSLDISDYRKRANGTLLTEQEKRGFWIEAGEKHLVDFMTRIPMFYYRIDHYDVTVSDVVHHHTVKLVSHEPFLGCALHPAFYDGGGKIKLSSGMEMERLATHDNGTTGYCWRRGDVKYYTKSAAPAEGDKIYSNSAATTEVSGVTVAEFTPGGSTPSDIYFAIYEGVLCDSDGIPKEQTADATQVSRAATDLFRSIMGYRPASNVTRANFRINAANNFSHLKSLLIHHALELLMEIDLGNINAQAALSAGLSNCSAWNYAETRKTGRSAAFGNSTVVEQGGVTVKPEILADEEISTITVGGVVYTRDTTADSGSGKAWKNGADTVYTKFEVPTVYVAASGSGATALPAFGDMAYSNAALTADGAAITDVTGLDYDFLHMATGGTSIWAAGKAHVVSFSWRGIENFYGEVWEFVDGCQKFQANDKDTITLSDSSVWNRYWAGNNGTTAYAWRSGETVIYTASATPGANAAVYTTSDKSVTDARTVSSYTVDFTDSGYWVTNDTDLYLRMDVSEGAGAYGEKFPSRGYTGDSLAWVWHPWPKGGGYILTYDDFSYLCLSVGGGESTYFGDYFYNDTGSGACVVYVGGGAYYGGGAGPGYANVGNWLGRASADIGARSTARADEGTDHLSAGA